MLVWMSVTHEDSVHYLQSCLLWIKEVCSVFGQLTVIHTGKEVSIDSQQEQQVGGGFSH